MDNEAKLLPIRDKNVHSRALNGYVFILIIKLLTQF